MEETSPSLASLDSPKSSVSTPSSISVSSDIGVTPEEVRSPIDQSPPFTSPMKTPNKPQRPCRKELFTQDKKRGRKPLYEEFPDIIPAAKEYLADHGWAAHGKRRKEQASVGVSVKQLTDHLNQNVPGLQNRGISKTAVAYLMDPPNKTRKSASRYKGLIPARVGIKRNNASKEHIDSHYCRALVAYSLEMARMFEEEVMVWSADDKNKLNVGGGPAVSRHIQLRAFFLRKDEPNYDDHDWSTGYKLIPSGYMRLLPKEIHQKKRSRSQSPPRCSLEKIRVVSHDDLSTMSTTKETMIYRDQSGRKHLSTPRTGPLTICLRGNKFCKSSSYNHYDDLLPIIRDSKAREKKHAAVIISDNGPDWQKKAVKVLLNVGRLWRDLDLDFLLLTSYAPGDSRFNMIEHAWAPITIWLAGLCLSATVPGEISMPKDQALSDSERKAKEEVILDNAMMQTKLCLRGRHFDGFPITVNAVPSTSNHLYNDEDLCEEMTKSGIRKLKRCPRLTALADEYKFLQDHCTQTTYGLEFIKCEDSQCAHCTKSPVRAKGLVGFLREGCGGRSIKPTMNPKNPGHYYSWLELVSLITFKRLPSLGLDNGLPSKEGSLSICPEDGCAKVFHSNADKKRHNILVHRK